ncbi:unnamed protein product [Rotaria sp. Silwood1]|nr:unnamed protein product [Rotaria sp. Silwood1]
MFPRALSRRTKRCVASLLLVRKQSKSETRCLKWTHVVTGALVPLMIGIFTVVLTIQQYRISERHREQDQQIARAYREQDQRQADDLHFQQKYTINEPAENVHVYFDGTQLIGADFCETTLCDVSFNGADLSYANFIKATLGGRIDFEGTNLALADFTNMWLQTPIFVNILNTNMAGVRCCGESWLRANQRGYIKMTNVILPNGTWLINETNLVLNGDAECKQQDLISHWSPFEHQFHSYPSLASNVTDRNCYFNFTTSTKPMFMYQEIDLSNYSLFVDTGEVEVDISADFGCSTNRSSELKMYIWLKDSLQTRLSKIELVLVSPPLKDGSEWQHWKEVRRILKPTRYLQMEIALLEEDQICSIDNIQLRLGRHRGAEGMKKRLKDGKILLF